MLNKTLDDFNTAFGPNQGVNNHQPLGSTGYYPPPPPATGFASQPMHQYPMLPAGDAPMITQAKGEDSTTPTQANFNFNLMSVNLLHAQPVMPQSNQYPFMAQMNGQQYHQHQTPFMFFQPPAASNDMNMVQPAMYNPQSSWANTLLPPPPSNIPTPDLFVKQEPKELLGGSALKKKRNMVGRRDVAAADRERSIRNAAMKKERLDAKKEKEAANNKQSECDSFPFVSFRFERLIWLSCYGRSYSSRIS